MVILEVCFEVEFIVFYVFWIECLIVGGMWVGVVGMVVGCIFGIVVDVVVEVIGNGCYWVELVLFFV